MAHQPPCPTRACLPACLLALRALVFLCDFCLERPHRTGAISIAISQLKNLLGLKVPPATTYHTKASAAAGSLQPRTAFDLTDA